MLSEEADRNRQRRFAQHGHRFPTSARRASGRRAPPRQHPVPRPFRPPSESCRKSRPGVFPKRAGKLEALAVDPRVKEKIKNNLNELNGILAGTNQAVAQRIDNLRNTERLVKRIRTLNADLPQLERELYASGMKPGDPASTLEDRLFRRAHRHAPAVHAP